MFAIVEGSIDVGALVSAAQRPDCGAVSTFVGTTRVDENEGASVEHLEYEAYRPMADRKLEEIGADERWDARFAQSSESLADLADEAVAEHRAGKTRPLDPDTL